MTRSLRLVTGAVLPVFNHPLKLAGQIGMVDAISGGRLRWASPAPSCPTSSPASASRWTRAGPGSMKAST